MESDRESIKNFVLGERISGSDGGGAGRWTNYKGKEGDLGHTVL